MRRRVARLTAVALAVCLAAMAIGGEGKQDVNLQRAIINYKSNKFNEAIEELKIALRRNERNGEALLWLGKCYARISEFDKAEENLAKAVQLVPDSEDAYAELTNAYVELDARARGRGELDRARDYLEKAESAAKTLLQRQPREKTSFELLIRLAKHEAGIFAEARQPDKERDKYEEALVYCEEVLKIDPNDISTHLDRIHTLFGLRRTKEAERRCQEVLKINPQLHEPKLIMVQVRRMEGDMEGALKLLGEILAAKPSHVEALLRRAELYLDLQKYDEALADANEALRLTTKNPYANFIRGCVYMQLRKLDAAIQELQFAATGMPRHIMSHYWLARCLLLMDRLREAIDELNQVVKLDPRFILARLALASAQLQNAYPDGAIATLVDALHFDANNVEVYRLLGVAYLHKGEHERAKTMFQKMLALDPEQARAHQVLAGIELAQGNVDKAIAHCRTALDVEPKNVDVHFLLGMAYVQRQRFEGAKTEFEHVLTIRDKHPGARMNLAAVHIQLREYDLAQEQLLLCIKDSPDLPKPRYALARLYMLQRKFDKAESELTQLLKNEAERANVHLAMAELRLAKGEKEGAIEAAKTALSINAKLLEARTFLARLYISDQNWASALAELEAALKENPKHAPAYEAAVIQVYLTRYDEAVKLFEKAVQSDVSPASSLAGQAAALQLKGELRAAHASISDADKRKPQDPLLALQTLSIYLGQGEVANARTLLRQATYVPDLVKDAYTSFLDNFAEDKARSRAVSDALTRIIFFGSRGWHDQAEENCNILVKLAPDNTFAYTVLANVYLATGRPEKEVATLQRLVEIAPKDHRHRLRLARRRADLGQFTEARKEFERAAADNPKSTEPLLELGGYFLRMAQYDLAAEQAKKALAIEEGDPKALALLASCQLAEGKRDEARGTLRRITESKNAAVDDEVRRKLAFLDFAEGKYDAAIAQFEEAIKANPKNIQARMGLGEAFHAKGNLQRAIEHYREALALDATFSPALIALSRVYRDQGRLDLSLDYCEQAAEVNPGAVELRFELASVRLAQRKFDEAIAEYTAILKDRPNDHRARIGIATALFDSGQRQAAFDQLAELLTQVPGLGPARAALVLLYKRLGEIDKAQAELENLIRTSGPGALGVYDLAVVYIHKDRLDPAIEIADQRLKNDEKDIDFLVLRGVAAQLKGQLPEALDALNRAASQAPKNARLASLLANAYVAAGKAAEARKVMDAVEMPPELQAAYRKLIEQLSVGGEASRLAANSLNQAALYANAGWLTLAADRYETLLKTLANNLAVLQLAAGVYEQMRERAKCIETYQRMLQANPDYEPALHRLAVHHTAEGNLEAAAGDFRNLLAKKRDDVTVILGLATILERQHKPADAIELYKRILKTDPSNPIAVNNLAWLYAEVTKDLKAAEELATKAVQLTDPESAAGAATRDTLAWILYRTERYDKALDLARQAVQGMPGSAEVHYHAGMIYFKKNLRASAARHLLAALKLDPAFPEKDEINKVLDRIRKRQL